MKWQPGEYQNSGFPSRILHYCQMTTVTDLTVVNSGFYIVSDHCMSAMAMATTMSIKTTNQNCYIIVYKCVSVGQLLLLLLYCYHFSITMSKS